MYKVILCACGNIDHGENPFSNIVNGEEVDVDIAECASIEGCQQAVLRYIDTHNLGAGNWIGGSVFDEKTQIIGHISYNGRFWPANANNK